MSLLDRLMIAALLGTCLVLIVAFAVLGERVSDVDDRLAPTTIVTEEP